MPRDSVTSKVSTVETQDLTGAECDEMCSSSMQCLTLKGGWYLSCHLHNHSQNPDAVKAGVMPTPFICVLSGHISAMPATEQALNQHFMSVESNIVSKINTFWSRHSHPQQCYCQSSTNSQTIIDTISLKSN